MSRLPGHAVEVAVPELRGEARLRDLESRLAALEGSLGAKGRLIDVRHMFGQNNAYSVHTAGAVYADAAHTIPMALSYTPPIDVWWEVDGTIGIIDCTAAAYNYAYGYLQLSPADADSVATGGQQVATQRTDVNKFGNRSPSYTYKLVAGTAYTVTLSFTYNAVGWQIFQDAALLQLEAKAWAR
jgi:hypothetical protein